MLSVVKTEFILLFWINQKPPLNMRERVSNRFKQSKVIFINDGTIPKATILCNPHCTFISPIYTFPWRET